MHGPPFVRSFIQSALYRQGAGYFESRPVHDAAGLLGANFPSLGDMSAWKDLVRARYRNSQESTGTSKSTTATGRWSTPVELFQPHYSRCVASWIARELGPTTQPFNVVEIGGGNGTNAKHVLEHLGEILKGDGEGLSYTLCEISPEMAKKQRDTLAKARLPPKASVKVVERDFLQWDTRQPPRTVVIALEVLDNLPCDKLRFLGKPSEVVPFSPASAHLWKLGEVVKDDLGRWVERFTCDIDKDALALAGAQAYLQPGAFLPPLSRPRVFHRFPRSVDEAGSMLARGAMRQSRDTAEQPVSLTHQDYFVPTGVVQFVNVLKAWFPDPMLVIADFDELPASDAAVLKNQSWPGALVGCVNHPIVSGPTHDYPTYLMDPGSADVFFQVHFPVLRDLVRAAFPCNGGAVTVLPSHEFLCQFPQHVQGTTLRDGSNPMLFEFQNTSFLTRS